MIRATLSYVAVFGAPLAVGWASGAGWFWVAGSIGAIVVVGSMLWVTKEGE